MIKCINGHKTNNFTKCETCSQPADLQQSLNTLQDIPEFKAIWKQKTILTAGIPTLNREDTYNLNIQPAETPTENENTFTYKTESGETWHDITTKNSQRFQEWIHKTGFYQQKYKLITLDTTNPAALLPILHMKNTPNLAVFAVTADANSNSIEQNTSYATLKYAEQKKLPIITCPKNQVENLPFHIQDINLTINTDALNELTNFLADFLETIIDVMNRDQKLGVWTHTFTASFSASDTVYTNPKTALAMQQKTQENHKPEDTQTAYLFCRANQAQHQNLATAFNKQFNDKKTRLLNKATHCNETQTKHNLYDLLVLTGTKELNYKEIEPGYQLVAQRNQDLGVKNP